MKKLFAILCVLLSLTLCAFGCKKQPTQEDTYYRLFASHIAPTSAVKTDLYGYTFDEFLERGCIKVSMVKEEKTLYGVIDAASNKLLFAPTNAEVEMVGDFFLLTPGTDDAMYRVASLNGTILFESPSRPIVEDVGQGYVSVATDTESIVYDADGVQALPLSGMDEDYTYTACGNFMLATNSQGYFHIFNLRSGEVKWSLYPSANTTASVHYAGGNDFIVIYEEDVGSDGAYDVELQMSESSSLYLKQTICRVTIGVDGTRPITVNGYVASLTNQYSFGKTERKREAYPLKDGYFSMGLYNVTDKLADGSIRYALTDASLNVLAELPDGIRPDAEGATAGEYYLSGLQSSAVYLFNDILETVLTFSDGPYHSASLSDDVIILSKLQNGALRFAAYALNGTQLIDYKYSYLSEYISGKAIGVREGKSYLVGKDGSETYLSDDPLPYWWDGYYEYREGDHVGLRSYNGTTLTPADYETVDNYTRSGDTVYVAMKIGSAVDVYKLQ